VTALRYKSSESKALRICNEIGDLYEMPDDGWGNRLYAITTPSGATLGNQCTREALEIASKTYFHFLYRPVSSYHYRTISRTNDSRALAPSPTEAVQVIYGIVLITVN
jgi:hypothetical protein